MWSVALQGLGQFERLPHLEVVGACQVVRNLVTRRPTLMALWAEPAEVVEGRFLPEFGLERIRSGYGRLREIVQRRMAEEEEVFGIVDVAGSRVESGMAAAGIAAVAIESAGTAAEVAEIEPVEVAGTVLAEVAGTVGAVGTEVEVAGIALAEAVGAGIAAAVAGIAAVAAGTVAEAVWFAVGVVVGIGPVGEEEEEAGTG